MIVDTHVHVVSGDRKKYPILPDAPDWPITEIDGLVRDMDANGVDKAVLVQTMFTYGFDNSYMIDCAARYPQRFETVAVIDQTARNAPDVLSDVVEKHGVRGVRFMPKGFPAGVLTNPQIFPVCAIASDLGIPITVAAELEHLPGMPSVVERFPQAKIAFEHMWALELTPPFDSIKPIFELAQFSNVYLKLCPNNSHAVRDGKGKAEDFFGRLVARFGIERVMWGSNYPAHSHRFGGIKERLRIMQDDFAFLSAADRERFFSGNALGLWPRLK